MANLYSDIIRDLEAWVGEAPEAGLVASYIPELATVDPSHFGLCLKELNGNTHSCGEADVPFSIQSISKVFSLSLAYEKFGESIFERVGVEPSGNAFNSLLQLEYEKGIPRNPLINPGALVIADLLLSENENAKDELLQFVRKLCNNPSISFNLKVAESERVWGFRNAALANLLKAFNNIKNEVEAVLDFYFHMCSIEMSCQDLAMAFQWYAGLPAERDEKPWTLSGVQIKRINALMQSCGFYDESGEFAFRVGLAGKSGVGGGIVAVHPDEYSVAVWSPRLNKKGNSVIGMKCLEYLTTQTDSSIF